MNAVAKLNAVKDVFKGEQFSQLSSFYEEAHRIGWFFMGSEPRPCFTHTLLDDLANYVSMVKREMRETNQEKYDFLVFASGIKGVFNLGGDLDLFSRLIKERDRAALLDYAIKGIDLVYTNIKHFDSDLITISLIQGDALGGGLEAALSGNVIIAERGVKLGCPEALFNLFPGMGAYSILSRKLGKAQAEKIIMSGDLFTAEEFYEMGAVDILVEPGQGEAAVYDFIKSVKRSPNSYRAMQKVKDVCNNLEYQELLDIGEIWADAALELTEKDLRLMHRLVKRQTVNANALTAAG
ncbi:crotonase/enoyl-CoA hydratase family protein [Methylophaga sp. OBS3]|uniref:crotonase/enoyl-CoA hydratase family protein n=1 Tax=Methylophaga sp. OBS3 TaxID=2991934 RepID=UPI00224EA1D2|nr:crotonase/enoyl-CoA hydratase family protein [Methylophaga sp. OBS3]MCX4190596.1 crotonase/enoyl-CoA hydratase family protein [Methylophaga sp. OBS3]